jgi:hypothetical protein
MSSSEANATGLQDAVGRNSEPIAGADHADSLPAPFQYFASFWHQHKQGAGLPSFDILNLRGAPPVLASGIVFAAEDCGVMGVDFRVHCAGEPFEFYYRRDIRGCRLGDLFDVGTVTRRRARYARILVGGMPDYSRRRRSRIPGREIVWIERIYAPFADDSGAPAFIGGVVKLAYA